MPLEKTLKPSTTLNLTAEQLTKIIEESKKPDEETQAEEARQKRLRQNSRKMLREQMLRAQELKQAHEDNCNHLKEDGTSAIMGQAHTRDHAKEGSVQMYVGICIHCMKEWEPVPADRIPNIGGRSRIGDGSSFF